MLGTELGALEQWYVQLLSHLSSPHNLLYKKKEWLDFSSRQKQTEICEFQANLVDIKFLNRARAT